jgi:hypothetical protein
MIILVTDCQIAEWFFWLRQMWHTWKPMTYENVHKSAPLIHILIMSHLIQSTRYTPTSYSGGPGFDSRLRRPAILIEVFRGFPQSLQANAWIVP